jgi:hypothetical protein
MEAGGRGLADGGRLPVPLGRPAALDTDLCQGFNEIVKTEKGKAVPG